MNARAEHGRARQLISARIDGPLTASDERLLQAHLSLCPMCRIVERDLRRQHDELGRLPVRPVPRDLWARTSAAIDRDLSRAPREQVGATHTGDHPGAGRPGVAPGRAPTPERRASSAASGTRWLALTAFSSVTLAGIVLATQLQTPAILPSTPPTRTDAAVADPTPFAVSPQDLALIDFGANGMSVWQTRISEVCPQPSVDCTSGKLDPAPVLRIGGDQTGGRGVTLHSGDGRVAVVADDPKGGETVSIVDLPQYTPRDDVNSGGPRPTPTIAPRASSAFATPFHPSPLATQGPVQTTSPRATARPNGRPTPTPERSDHPSQQHTPPPGATPRPTRPPTPSPSRSPRPSPVKPAATGAPRSTRAPTSPAPRRSAAPSIRPATSSGPTIAPNNAGTSLPPMTQAPAQAALSIANGVRLAGAAPAWSPDGDMLAFSATPADRSSGPDVYLWRVGEARAQRLTSDHASYFASWDGNRIVASRPGPAAGGAGGISIAVVVIDTRSGAQRSIANTGVWLPVVQPGGLYAIAWMGRLGGSGHIVAPGSGQLYLVDWTALDPFAGGRARTVTATASPRPTRARRTAVPSARPGVASPAPPGGRHGPPGPGRPAASSTPGDEASPSPPAAAATPRSGATHHPRPSRTPLATQANQPSVIAQLNTNAASDGPVLDWVVRWSDDGSTIGIWIADAPGSNWGRLTVERVSMASGALTEQPILGPNLARRTFTMSTDRVAWIAPSDGSVDGELRVRTWGAQGNGEVRIPLDDTDGGVPAF